ncbi:MAG: hypothetical protein A3G81_17490 [Betaproteobacteria bacterium RIFCSPLOWO2_12_FULL_65_14]|nr:MAG: hypothetical protein A3G81_17490 [Betaproteobacteria bacterium RIFCSPLOWO2_12_FULL_65_14]
MTRNVGGADRALRWIVAIVALALAFFVELPPGWNVVAFVIGAVALTTALLLYCPINTVLGRNSRREPSSR